MNRRGVIWLALLGTLMVLSVVGPNPWAAPGQSLDRPTFPTPTTPAAPPPTQPPATATSPLSAPQPAQSTDTPAPTAEAALTTSSQATSIVEATATPAALATEVLVTATPAAPIPFATEVSEDELSTQTAPRPVEPGETPMPTYVAPAQAGVQGEVEGISFLLCAGVALMVAGLILLAVRRRGRNDR